MMKTERATLAVVFFTLCWSCVSQRGVVYEGTDPEGQLVRLEVFETGVPLVDGACAVPARKTLATGRVSARPPGTVSPLNSYVKFQNESGCAESAGVLIVSSYGEEHEMDVCMRRAPYPGEFVHSDDAVVLYVWDYCAILDRKN